MNYKQCEDFLELHKQNQELAEEQLESLRQQINEKKLDADQCKGKRILCLEPAAFPVSTVVYLEKTLKLAGYKVMSYCPNALGDYRNRWRVNGKALSQKNLCQIVENIQKALTQLDLEVPSRVQMEQLVAELAFAQSDARVLLWYDCLCKISKVEGVARCDVPTPTLQTLKVTKKTLKKQVFDYGKEKGISLAAWGKDALIGACQTLETLQVLDQWGMKVEKKHATAAFEEETAKNCFGVISYKPLWVLDDAQSALEAQRLAADIEEYLSGKALILLLGATKNTDVEGMLEELSKRVSFVLTVAPARIDRIPSYDLAQEVYRFSPNVTAVDSIEEAMEIIEMVLPKDGAVLTVGCQELLSQVIAIVNKDLF